MSSQHCDSCQWKKAMFMYLHKSSLKYILYGPIPRPPQTMSDHDGHSNQNVNKKAVLSQRWPRNAPYRPTWVPWKFSGIPDYAHGYYSQHFSWAFVRINSMNITTKFEVRSFTRSWDNRGYPKKLGTPRIRPRSIFSQIFNGLLFRLAI